MELGKPKEKMFFVTSQVEQVSNVKRIIELKSNQGLTMARRSELNQNYRAKSAKQPETKKF